MKVLQLLAAHGIRPDTSLGQHFLVDENLVDLALRVAEVDSDDVVLEVGAGPGVLTTAQARTARHVHTVELDRRVEPLLSEVLADADNVQVHWQDAMQLDLESLDPAPTAMVANLPYSIATPIVLESTWRLPSIRRWVVMVQREVADRWCASPGSRLYGAPTVLLAHCCGSDFRRNVGRDVFAPPPRVDSALVELHRTGPGASPQMRRLVRGAFSTRRKTLRNALTNSGFTADEVEVACAQGGVDSRARAETISPAQFARMAQ